jgi:hypothetical protein
MQAGHEVEVKQSFEETGYQAVLATVDFVNCKQDRPMHEALKEITITLHPAKKTPLGLVVLDADEWVALNEFDDEGSDCTAEILEPDEALTNDIIDEAKMRVWLRFAGLGIL